MKAINLVIIFLWISAITTFAQNDSVKVKHKNYPFVSIDYHFGNVMPTNEFIEGDNLADKPINNYQSINLKVGFQNPGYSDWQRVYRGPYYGIGFYSGDFFTSELGYPLAAYGFYGIPIKRWKKLELYSEFQFGMAWNWNHYDSISNPKNIAIGSPLTVYLDIGVNAVYPITKHLDLGGGISFTHFSNGGFERPNRGMNLYAPYVELKYHLSGRPNVRDIEKPRKLEKSNDLYFMLGYGDHQIVEHEFDTNYYAIAGIGVYYSIQHSNAFRSGPGIDFNFWWGLTANPDGTPGPIGIDNLTVGLVYAPELIIDRFSIITGFGIYAKHHLYGNFKQTYQRAGVKYQITDKFSAGFNVRAINFMLAEFLEFNVGYRIKWKK